MVLFSIGYAMKNSTVPWLLALFALGVNAFLMLQG